MGRIVILFIMDKAIEKTVQNRRGRRTRPLTASLIRKICALIEQEAVFPVTAARAYGIDDSTFYNWLRYGDEGREPYLDLVASIKRADAKAEAKFTSNFFKTVLQSNNGIEKATFGSRRWRSHWHDKAELEDATAGAMRGLAELININIEGQKALASQRGIGAVEQDGQPVRDDSHLSGMEAGQLATLAQLAIAPPPIESGGTSAVEADG